MACWCAYGQRRREPQRVRLQHAEGHRHDRPVDGHRLAGVEPQAHAPVVVRHSRHHARHRDVDAIGECVEQVGEPPGHESRPGRERRRRRGAGRDAVRRRARRGLHAARDRVREPGRRTESVGAGHRGHRHRARVDERGRERDVGGRGLRPGSCGAHGLVARRRDGHRDALGRARLDHAVERRGVDGCRAEGLDQRLVVGHEHRPELDGPVESVDVDRPHASAHAIARLDDDDLEARVDEVHRGGQSRHAGADHGDALARLGDASDLLGGVLPGVARAGERARVAGGARLAGDPEPVADGFGERGAEPRGRADGVERERAAREGVGAPARPPHRGGQRHAVGRHGRRSGRGRRAGGRRRRRARLGRRPRAARERDAGDPGERRGEEGSPGHAAGRRPRVHGIQASRPHGRRAGGRRAGQPQGEARVNGRARRRRGTPPRTGAGPPRSSPSSR